jgi:hypothetical protein
MIIKLITFKEELTLFKEYQIKIINFLMEIWVVIELFLKYNKEIFLHRVSLNN